MAGFTDYTAENILNYLTGRAAMPAMPTAYVALFTTPPSSDSGVTGAVEVSGAGYARLATSSGDWNAAQPSSGSEPSVTPAYIQNSSSLSYATASGNWGTANSFGIFDAVSGGNNLAWDYLGNYTWNPVTMDAVSTGAGGVVTHPNNGYSNGTSVVVTTKYGGSLPTVSGTANFTGILSVTGVTTNTYTLLSSGASAILTTTSGDFQIRQVTQQAIPSGVAATFPASALTLTSA